MARGNWRNWNARGGAESDRWKYAWRTCPKCGYCWRSKAKYPKCPKCRTEIPVSGPQWR